MPKLQLRRNPATDKYAITGDKEYIMLIWDMTKLFLNGKEDDDDEDNIDDN